MKNISIQVLRIISMFFIILGCHLISEFNIPILNKLGQFFNVGVFIFLFISGYLFGKREAIGYYYEWIKHRLKKILVPIYLFLIFYWLIKIFLSSFELKYFIISMLNLEYFFGAPLGIGHFWFISIILLCYIFTPILKKFNLNAIYVFIFISAIVCYINPKIGQCLYYLLTYLIGLKFEFFTQTCFYKYLNNFFIIVIFALFVIIRLLGLIFLDNTVMYNNIIFSITQIGIGISIIIFFFKNSSKLSASKMLNFLDSISYYIYITHYIFMVGPLRTMNLTKYLLLNSIITILLGLIFALFLKKLTSIFLINYFKIKHK